MNDQVDVDLAEKAHPQIKAYLDNLEKERIATIKALATHDANEEKEREAHNAKVEKELAAAGGWAAASEKSYQKSLKKERKRLNG